MDRSRPLDDCCHGKGWRLPISVGSAFFLATLVPIAPAPATADQAEEPPAAEVTMARGRFVPGDACVVRDAGQCVRVEEPLTITPDTKVSARNLDFLNHDLRSEAITPKGRSLFLSPLLLLGESGSVRVNTADGRFPLGTYRFYCTLHPPGPDETGMSGTIKVVEEVES